MRIRNAFQLGLVATLGVGVGLLIWGVVDQLATVITYVGAALFLALGLDPLLTWLGRHKVPRWCALLVVVLGVLGIFTALISTLTPLILQQAGSLRGAITTAISSAQVESGRNGLGQFIDALNEQFDLAAYIDLDQVLQSANLWLSDPTNIANIGNGVLRVGVGIANGLFGAIIILILTLYFTASLPSMKRSLSLAIPASKRRRFVEITEEISKSVGHYVVGQTVQASLNGVLSFIMLSIIGAPYPVLLAAIAFILSLIPLVGTLSGAIIITTVSLFAGASTAISAGIYYIIYMQIEAYVISPRIMKRAVSVPAPVVVIAALAGGTLLGVLGALIAIPVAAALIILIRTVVRPKVDAL